MKQVSLKVVENGGIVRSIQNHGLRTFPHRFKAKYPDYLTQQRYYEQGRFISIYYDSNPTTLKQVETVLTMNDQVLRVTHLKSRSKLDWINYKHEKNPYVQRVLKADRDAVLENNQKAEEIASISTAAAAAAVAGTSTSDNIDNVIDNVRFNP